MEMPTEVRAMTDVELFFGFDVWGFAPKKGVVKMRGFLRSHTKVDDALERQM